MIDVKDIPAFTLIELLVSIALSALLIILLNNQIMNSISSDKIIKTKVEYRLEIENILSHLEADILSASHLPNGQKSFKSNNFNDQLNIAIKRIGISSINQELLGAEIIWNFSTSGISRSIRSKDGNFDRPLSNRNVKAHIDKIGVNIIKIIIKSDNFTKSKLIEL